MTDSLQDVVAAYVCGMTPGMNRVNLQLDGPIPDWADLGCHVRLSALAAPVVSDADRRDAERYRWLKNRSLNNTVMDSKQQNGPFIAVGSILVGWSTPMDIDGAIDAAIAALSPGRGGEEEQ